MRRTLQLASLALALTATHGQTGEETVEWMVFFGGSTDRVVFTAVELGRVESMLQTAYPRSLARTVTTAIGSLIVCPPTTRLADGASWEFQPTLFVPTNTEQLVEHYFKYLGTRYFKGTAVLSVLTPLDVTFDRRLGSHYVSSPAALMITGDEGNHVRLVAAATDLMRQHVRTATRNDGVAPPRKATDARPDAIEEAWRTGILGGCHIPALRVRYLPIPGCMLLQVPNPVPVAAYFDAVWRWTPEEDTETKPPHSNGQNEKARLLER